jgi:hypothetical protein
MFDFEKSFNRVAFPDLAKKVSKIPTAIPWLSRAVGKSALRSIDLMGIASKAVTNQTGTFLETRLSINLNNNPTIML